jgi:hypothetical protein
LQAVREKETPKLALARLLDDLGSQRRLAGVECVQHHRNVLPGTKALLGAVPLLHGVTDIDRFRRAVTDRALRPRASVGMPRLEAEDYLRLKDVVYTAAGILYPDRAFALVLSPSVEESRAADASPWDSASFYRSLCPHLPPAKDSSKRLEVFLSHTLPAPEYRQFLVDYVATHFSSGRAYLSAEQPTFADAAGAFCDSFTSRVFEVRFDGDVPLETWSVDMIFVPRDAGGRESLALRRLLEPFSKKNRVQRYEGSKDTLQDRARSWLIDRLSRSPGAT